MGAGGGGAQGRVAYAGHAAHGAQHRVDVEPVGPLVGLGVVVAAQVRGDAVELRRGGDGRLRLRDRVDGGRHVRHGGHPLRQVLAPGLGRGVAPLGGGRHVLGRPFRGGVPLCGCGMRAWCGGGGAGGMYGRGCAVNEGCPGNDADGVPSPRGAGSWCPGPPDACATTSCPARPPRTASATWRPICSAAGARREPPSAGSPGRAASGWSSTGRANSWVASSPRPGPSCSGARAAGARSAGPGCVRSGGAGWREGRTGSGGSANAMPNRAPSESWSSTSGAAAPGGSSRSLVNGMDMRASWTGGTARVAAAAAAASGASAAGSAGTGPVSSAGSEGRRPGGGTGYPPVGTVSAGLAPVGSGGMTGIGTTSGGATGSGWNGVKTGGAGSADRRGEPWEGVGSSNAACRANSAELCASSSAYGSSPGEEGSGRGRWSAYWRCWPFTAGGAASGERSRVAVSGSAPDSASMPRRSATWACQGVNGSNPGSSAAPALDHPPVRSSAHPPGLRPFAVEPLPGSSGPVVLSVCPVTSTVRSSVAHAEATVNGE
ncbi:hypothetical protein ACFQY4_02900 [Catellatospora bangladeshensis]|uniref:hypothetical protein n=1 Tax=Catellatospora bangladeshensis TaxID=310355 RepID=UPI0036240C68